MMFMVIVPVIVLILSAIILYVSNYGKLNKPNKAQAANATSLISKELSKGIPSANLMKALGTKQNELFQCLSDLKELKEAGKQRSDKEVKLIEKHLIKVLQIDSTVWFDETVDLSKLVGYVQVYHNVLIVSIMPRPVDIRTHSTDHNIDSEYLLTHASGGRALQGALLQESFDSIITARRNVIQIPETYSFSLIDAAPIQKTLKFDSSEAETFYKNFLVCIGYQMECLPSVDQVVSYAKINIPYVSSTQENASHYASTILQTVFSKATLKYKMQQLKLSCDAIQELQKIQIEAEQTSPTSPKALLACIQFFQTFGSHVCCGPYTFGGIHWIKCSSNDAVYGAGAHEEFIEKTCSMLQIVPSSKLNTNHFSAAKLSDTAGKTNGMSLDLFVNGGCANGNVVEWCVGVALNSYDWQIVDCSDNYTALWDIILLNHATDLDVKLVTDALKFAFHQMDTNPNIEKKLLFLEYLDLIDKYIPPNQLSMHYAMSIRESTLDKNECTDPKELVLLLLQKIMSQDSRSRNNLLARESAGIELEFSTHAQLTEDVTSCQDIHPMDSFLGLFLCSDPFLRQDMMVRIASCQLSVPIITVDPISQDIVLHIWAASTIIKSWKRTDEKENIIEAEHPILKYPAHIVSFIRLGTNRLPISKSKAMNAVLSDSNYNHFFHRDCDGGTFSRVLSEGLVDMCWYLPGGKTGDVFPDAVTFLNLHGNAFDHRKQVDLLYEMTSLCFIFIGKKNIEKQEIELILKFSSFVLLLAEGIPENINDIAENYNFKVITLFDKNEHGTKAEIRKTIGKNLKFNCATTRPISLYLENISMVNKIKLDKDNKQFREGEKLANELLQLVENTENAKQKILPLQGKELWQKWAQHDKEQHRQVMRGSHTITEYTSKMETAKKSIRHEQRKKIDNLNPIIVQFITSVQNSDKFVVFYFLKCLNNGLNSLSRSTIGSLQNQYQSTRKKLASLQAENDAIQHSKSDEELQTQKELDVLHQKLIDNSFGLEHILREIGQVYETVIDLGEQKQFAYLPDLAASLLIDGYPLEVMDGDAAAHLPKQWVQAVLKRTKDVLGDPRIFILSVLGLQSTGKSTMLNAVFGLQFTVSSGRCTRGVYMQLVPISEELKASGLKCDYILVLDTEGLRAPELDPAQTQKHDNELATFVIGLANTTLINIYGEVPGEMDNILQTAVHAFIRMRQVSLKPSCQFVHQNAGNSSKSDMGRVKFTQKLNRMTIEAAREEGCVDGEFERFNSVIKFDDQKDVHHFTSLWMGDPPMAPVNHGYSQEAQLLKKAMITMIKETKCTSLDTFKQKLGDLWNALLHERFVFSFKNTMEITAYNSLEAEYNKHRLKFKDQVLKWQEKMTNAIEGAGVEALQDIENEKINGLKPQSIQQLVQNLKSQFEKELKEYFESSKQAEIIIQWQATFIHRLARLAEGLLTETTQHCIHIIKNKRLNAGIRSEKEHYKLKIIGGVKEIVEGLKKERQELENNIESGNVTNEQLTKICKQGLMSQPKLQKFLETKVISQESYDYISSFGQLSESKLKRIFRKLNKEEVFHILSQDRLTDAELKEHFAKHWAILLGQLPEYKPQDRDIVEVTVHNDLTQHFGAGDVQSISDMWTHGQQCQSSELLLQVTPEHLKKPSRSRSHIMNAFSFFGAAAHPTITNADIHQAQQLSDSVISNMAEFFNQHRHRSTYNTGLVSNMLKCLDEAYQRIITNSENQQEFKFKTLYRIHLYVVVCKYAVVHFQGMVDDDNRRNDPRVWLEEEMKDQLFTSFKNQYHQIAHEESVATTLCDPMVRIVLKQLNKTLGRLIGHAVGSGIPHFSTKVALKVKIMIDLAEDLQKNGNFTPYVTYLTDVKFSMIKWVKAYIKKYCEETSTFDENKTNYMVLASQKVDELINLISTTAKNVTKSFKPAEKVSTRWWIEKFCEDVVLIEALGDTAMMNVCGLHEDDDGAEQQLELASFHTELENAISKAKQTILQKLPECKNMNRWETSPEKFLKHVTGCLEQCPFCGEPCDREEHDTDEKNDIWHSAQEHRQSCIIGYRYCATKVMVIETCTTLVESEKRFRKKKGHGTDESDDEYHPYKEYKTVYPSWHIPADRSMEVSLYWKWLVGHYHEKLEEYYDMLPADIPEEWTNLQWPAVKSNLKSHYNLL